MSSSGIPKKPSPTLQPERDVWHAGAQRVAGLDEAGRGPLAGPVVACAVHIDRDYLEGDFVRDFDGLNDSKQVSAAFRDVLYAKLVSSPRIRYGVGLADVGEIDRLNILQATYLAMRRALEALASCDHVLVDGRPVPGLPVASTAIVKGDSASFSIAAASIIAKVTRDRLMDEFDRLHPVYGFARNRGYGTPSHLAALAAHGPCSAHRRSFAPVAQQQLDLK